MCVLVAEDLESDSGGPEVTLGKSVQSSTVCALTQMI